MQPIVRSTVVVLFVALGTLPVAAQPLEFAKVDAPSARGARAIVVADFNRDGWPDVAQAGIEPNAVSILLNARGRESLRYTIPVGVGPFDIATDDFDRDGIPDLVVANADSNTLSILTGQGDGRFTRTDIGAHSSPRGVATGDINGDGNPDFVHTAYVMDAVVLSLGDGRGGFRTNMSVGYAEQPQDVRLADVNRDGHLDLVVAFNAPEGLIVWTGPVEALSPTVIPGASYLNVLDVADLNADGWLDVAAASTDRARVAVYFGSPSGLAYRRSYSVDPDPRGITIADLNADGALDIATANRATNTVNVLLGDPAHRGSFLPRLTLAAGIGSRALAATDVNADGRIDLVIGNQYAASSSVLLNESPRLRAAYTFGHTTLPSSVELSSRIYSNEASSFAVGDFNRDGKLDFVQRIAESVDVAVVLTNGDTVVLPGVETDGAEAYAGHVVADFNDDGELDVVVIAGGITYLGNGHGQFSARVTGPFSDRRCVPGDMNRDGRLDLVCPGQVMLGYGTGVFARGARFTSLTYGADFGYALQVADLNRDGTLDVVGSRGEIWLGDGSGELAPATPALEFAYSSVAVANVNHDGYVDLVFNDSTSLFLWPGSAAGYQGTPEPFYGEGLEANLDVVMADVNADGDLDIVINFLVEDADRPGIMKMLPGRGDGTFGDAEVFALPGGEILAADVTKDGLLDIVVAKSREIHVLVNERNDTNRPPLVTAPDVTAQSVGCIALPVQASDPDQHAVFVTWQGGDVWPTGMMGKLESASACVESPGTYRYQVSVSDHRGAVVTRSFTVTVEEGPAEIVLYAADAETAGRWSLVSDPLAAGGTRAYDRNAGTAKVTTPAAQPANFITLAFVADPARTYKLWLRLKADGNDYGNDSVWVQFSGSATQSGSEVYRIGTMSGLAVNLEECANCGTSGWGWEDDGWGAVNRNGVTLRFPEGGQQWIRIQTREDGVSVDQIVLSAAQYVTTRPGAAKNDTTILKKTP